MNSVEILTTLLLLSLISIINSQSLIQINPNTPNFNFEILSTHRKIRLNHKSHCDSWRFSVETNDAGLWKSVPERCVSYVTKYVSGDRYWLDSEEVAGDSLEFAKTVEIAGDGKDAWVFDIDETLLSNLPYEVGVIGSVFDEPSFDAWVDLAKATALPASLALYKELQELGFTILLLTGRPEFQRDVTMKNLIAAGYTNFKSLLLRGPSDLGKPAVAYKSEKRKELEDEGYRIHGNSGDQWSDLMGYAIATRSFKLPNPMYYID